MKTLFLFFILTVCASAQLTQNQIDSARWSLPLSQQDTTITTTIPAARVDSIVYVTAAGRRVVQAVLDAERIAARIRIGRLAEWHTPAEVEAEVLARRTEVAAQLRELDAETLTAADYRAAARAIKARIREYTKTAKKGSPALE